MNTSDFAHFYDISKNTLAFIDWCDLKFRIEEIGEITFASYKEMIAAYNLKAATNASTKEKQFDRIKQFADVESPKRKITISNLKYPEFAEYSGPIRGVYQEIFNLIFRDWIENKDHDRSLYRTEDIALEMGLLKYRYSSLKRVDFDCDSDYKAIVDSDKLMRLINLVDTQLMQVCKTSSKKYTYHRIYRTWSHSKRETSTDEFGSYEKIVPTDELKDEQAIKLLDEKQTFFKGVDDDDFASDSKTKSLEDHRQNDILFKQIHTEYKDVIRVWNIIKASNPNYQDLDTDFKDLLIRILLYRKQEKVYRDLLFMRGVKLGAAGMDLEGSGYDEWRARHNLNWAEQVYDGFSIFDEFEVKFEAGYGNKDYKRLSFGKDIDGIRAEVKKSRASMVSAKF